MTIISTWLIMSPMRNYFESAEGPPCYLYVICHNDIYICSMVLWLDGINFLTWIEKSIKERGILEMLLFQISLYFSSKLSQVYFSLTSTLWKLHKEFINMFSQLIQLLLNCKSFMLIYMINRSNILTINFRIILNPCFWEIYIKTY